MEQLQIQHLNNMKILITSGGTRVPIDDVRYIGNISTGRFGAELAEQFDKKFECDITYFISKGGIAPKFEPDIHYQGCPYRSIIQYRDYNEYLNVVEIAKTQQPDIIISAAAVSDYTLDKTEGKISSTDDELLIHLRKATKVLPLLKRACPNAMIVGFKLLVNPRYEEVEQAVRKVLNNGASYVVYNDLARIKQGDTKRLVFYQTHGYLGYEVTENAEDLVSYINNRYEYRNS